MGVNKGVGKKSLVVSLSALVIMILAPLMLYDIATSAYAQKNLPHRQI